MKEQRKTKQEILNTDSLPLPFSPAVRLHPSQPTSQSFLSWMSTGSTGGMCALLVSWVCTGRRPTPIASIIVDRDADEPTSQVIAGVILRDDKDLTLFYSPSVQRYTGSLQGCIPVADVHYLLTELFS